MYTIILADMTDRYYYADLIDNESMFFVDEVESLDEAKAIANHLFRLQNRAWKSLEDMNELDAGFDVWVFENNRRVYRAHETYKDKWFK